MRNLHYIKVIANLSLQYDRRPPVVDRYFKLMKLAPSDGDEHFYFDERLPPLPDTSLTGQTRMDFLKMDGVLKLSIDTLDDSQAAGRLPAIKRRFFYYEQLINPAAALVEAIEEEHGVWWAPTLVNQFGKGTDRLYSVILMRDTVRFPDLIGRPPATRQPSQTTRSIMTPPTTPIINTKTANAPKPLNSKPTTIQPSITTTGAKTTGVRSNINTFRRTFAIPCQGSSGSDSIDDEGATLTTKGTKPIATSSQISNRTNNSKSPTVSWSPSPIHLGTTDLDDSNDDIFSQIDLEALSRPPIEQPTVATKSNQSNPNKRKIQIVKSNPAKKVPNSSDNSNCHSSNSPADDIIEICVPSSPEREDPLFPRSQKRMKIHSPAASKPTLHAAADQCYSSPTKRKEINRSFSSNNRQTEKDDAITSEDDDRAAIIEMQYRLNWAKRALSENANLDAQRETATDDEDGADESDNTVTAKAIQRARERSRLGKSFGDEIARLRTLRLSIKKEKMEAIETAETTAPTDETPPRHTTAINSKDANDSDKGDSDASTAIGTPPGQLANNYRVHNDDSDGTPDRVTIAQFLAQLQSTKESSTTRTSDTPTPTVAEQQHKLSSLIAKRHKLQTEATLDSSSTKAITYPTNQKQEQDGSEILESPYHDDLVKQHILELHFANAPPCEPYEANGVRRYVINYTHSSWRFVRPRATDRQDPQLLMRRRIGSSNQFNYYAITNNMSMFNQAQQTENGAIRMKIPGDSETLHFVRIIAFDKLCDSIYKQWIAAARQERIERNHASSQRFYFTVHCDPIVEFMLDPIDIGNHAKIMNTIKMRYMGNPKPPSCDSRATAYATPTGRRNKNPLPKQLIDLEHSQFSESISSEDAGIFAAREALKRQLERETIRQTAPSTTAETTVQQKTTAPTRPLPTTPRRPDASILGRPGTNLRPANHSQGNIISQQTQTMNRPTQTGLHIQPSNQRRNPQPPSLPRHQGSIKRLDGPQH